MGQSLKRGPLRPAEAGGAAGRILGLSGLVSVGGAGPVFRPDLPYLCRVFPAIIGLQSSENCLLLRHYFGSKIVIIRTVY